MKRSRFPLVLLASAVATFAFAAPAQATEHQQRISEVMLQAAPSGPAAQFVELKDAGGAEPFPHGPYELVPYNAAGNPGAAVQLTPPASADLNSWTAMSVEAQVALGVIGDQPNNLALDPANGQVCFESTTGPSPGPITCVNWGEITVEKSGSGTLPKAHIPTPGDGQSARLCGTTYTVAAPTPKASNGCPATGGGGGGGGGGGSTPGTGTTPPTATVAPKPELSGASSSKLKSSLSVTVACPNAPCLASASGTLFVPNASKTFKIKSDPVQIEQGKSATLKIKLSSKARKAAKKALKAGKKVKAKLTITAKNSAGSSTAKKTIKLRR